MTVYQTTIHRTTIYLICLQTTDVSLSDLSSNNTVKWRYSRTLSQYSETKLLPRQSKWSLQRWARRETTDLGYDAQFMVFVWYRATGDYVEQFLFCCPLAKHTTRKVMFNKVYSFTKEHQLLQTHSVSVCADGALGTIRIKMALWIYEKG